MEDTIILDCEYTDTFGGQANYSWVDRTEIKVHETISDLALVRKAKRALRLNGVRGKTSFYGDTIEFKPYNSETIEFFTLRY